MTDILERLRKATVYEYSPLADEAADEIERLRGKIERLREALRKIAADYCRAQAIRALARKP